MKKILLFLLLIFAPLFAQVDKLLEKLPPGCFLQKAMTIPHQTTENIGKKLGVPLKGLSNNYLLVHGSQIKVNILETYSTSEAKKLHLVILNMKGHPAFCLRLEKKVIEYVGASLALANVTSYELGFVPKPKHVQYKVQAHIAMIKKADYMALNPLFQAFLIHPKHNPKRVSQIAQLTKKIQFGQSVVLRTPSKKGSYQLIPKAEKIKISSSTTEYSFAQPPIVSHVPYFMLQASIHCHESRITPSPRKADSEILQSTSFWPSSDPQLVKLARQITTGQETTEAKVEAILRWLTPGKNIQYGGTTGSRWGVKKVLQQKFGHCWDFSDCFVTLSRAAGIPSRQVGGWLYGTSGHIWAEVLLVGKGWLQVDPTGGGQLKCGIYHIPYFSTENGEMPIMYVSWPKIEIVQAK